MLSLLNRLVKSFSTYLNREEEEKHKRLERLNRFEKMKGMEFSFKPKWADKVVGAREGSYWRFLIQTEEGKEEYYHYRTRFAAPPSPHCPYYLFSYKDDGLINVRRFMRLFELVKDYGEETITIRGVTALHFLIEDTEEFLIPVVTVKDQEGNILAEFIL